MNTFDKILIEVGSFGWFQIRSYAFVCILGLAASCVFFAQVFVGGTGDHWCRVSHWEHEDCSELGFEEEQCLEFKKNLSAPLPSEDVDPMCMKYNVSEISLMEAYENQDLLLGLDIVPCDSGWHFSRSVFTSTFTEEWELVCERSSIPNVLQSIFLVGVLVGCIGFGAMADRVGRYYTLVTATLLCVIFGILCAVPSNIYVYALLRFGMGAAVYGTILTGFVHATEMVRPSTRVTIGVLIWAPYAIGYFLIPAIARYVPNWRIQMLIFASPFVVLVPYLFVMTESPRWLLSKSRPVQAEKLIRKMARLNGRTPPEDLASMIKEETEFLSTQKSASYGDLFRHRQVRIYTLNLMYNWFVQSFVYFGLSLGTSSLGVSPYIAFCISGVVEVLAIVCSINSMKYVGRKPSTAILMILAGFSCLTTTFVPLGAARVTFAMIGKFAIASSFDNIYVHTAEIFPTPLRTVGIGSCSIAARIGGIVAPLVLVLEKAWLPLPLILFASSSVVAGLLVYFLPETKGRPMPDTIADITALQTVNRYGPVETNNPPTVEGNGNGVKV